MIYLRYDVCFADDIRFAYEENGYYIILAVSKYIMRQSRISYCESNISLKNATFNDKIHSKKVAFKFTIKVGAFFHCPFYGTVDVVGFNQEVSCMAQMLNFKSSYFENAVREVLNIFDCPIFLEDAEKITQFDLSEFTFQNVVK